MLDQMKGLKKGAKKICKGGVGDISDWLHSATALLLCLFAVAYLSKAYGTEPIACFPPPHWAIGWNGTANTSCYNGLLFVHSFDGYHPLPPESEMNTRQVIFHRFAMWVAMGQGALFLVPGQIWKGMHGQNRAGWDSLMGRARRLLEYDAEAEQRTVLGKRQEGDGSEADRLADDLIRDLAGVLQLSNQKRQPVRFLGFTIMANSWLNSRYQLLAYVAVKLIQLGNICGQLLALNRLISVDDMHYLTWVPNQLTGGWWSGQPNRKDVSLFGVRVMCTILTYARPGHLGNNERHYMPCELPINTWNGVFYSFFWAWSMLLIGLTTFSLLGALLTMVPYLQRRRVKLVMSGNGYEKADPAKVREFVKSGLGCNGVFLLQLVESNAGGEWAQVITRALFDRYREMPHDIEI